MVSNARWSPAAARAASSASAARSEGAVSEVIFMLAPRHWMKEPPAAFLFYFFDQALSAFSNVRPFCSGPLGPLLGQLS
jgi:hypothetical protein